MGSSWWEEPKERNAPSRRGLFEAEAVSMEPLKVALPRPVEPPRAAMPRGTDAVSAQWPAPDAMAALPVQGSATPYDMGIVQAILEHSRDHHASLARRDVIDLLGRAMDNLQQMEALDGLISCSIAAGSQFTSLPHFQVAERRRLQVQRETMILLSQLRSAQQPQTQPPPAPSAWGATAAAALPVGEWAATPPPPGGCWAPQQPPPWHCGGWEAPEAPPHWQETPWSCDHCEGAVAPQRPAPTLSNSLQLLADVDSEHIFIVRRINKLGFKASKTLRDHFSQYGKVVRVLVAHSTVQAQGEAEGCFRQRPSSLGFLQMTSKTAVQQVLDQGEEQQVEDVVIRVQKFVRKQPGNEDGDAKCEEGGVDQLQTDGGDPDVTPTSTGWDRQFTSSSTARSRLSSK